MTTTRQNCHAGGRGFESRRSRLSTLLQIGTSRCLVRRQPASWPIDKVKDLIGGVPGFVSYTAFRSGEGGITLTVCQDKTGTDDSSRRAAEWVKENIGATANPPVITEGSTVVQFNS